MSMYVNELLAISLGTNFYLYYLTKPYMRVTINKGNLNYQNIDVKVTFNDKCKISQQQ